MLNPNKSNVDISILTKGSRKKLFLLCDYCNEEIIKEHKVRLTQNKKLDKDACKKCKFKKREEICLLEHGVKNYAQTKECKDKIKETNIEKYGCAVPVNGNKKVKEKAKQTNLERYGVENAFQNKNIQEKYKQSINEKYGVDNISQVEEVKNKKKQTNLEKFGNEEFLASEEGKEKRKKSMLEKYGVENAFQIPENIENFKLNHHMKDKEHAKEVHKKVVKTKIEKGLITVYDGKTLPELAKQQGFSSSRFHTLVKQHGIDYALKMTPYESSLETAFASWLDEEGISYRKNVRLENTRPDFVLDNNIIIELDGLYWHSEACQEDNNYHYNKKETYDRLGYKSFFFREDELRDKFDIVKSIVLNAVGKSNRIFARKTKIVELSKEESMNFLLENHLMGNGKGRTFALIYNDFPVSLIRISRTKDDQYDISRFCNKLGYNVVGGFSKLLKYAEKELNMSCLTTFVDRRYGSGYYLKDFGFTKETCYKSFKWTDGTNSMHRLRFKNQDGYNSGLTKIWDCGQIKYKKAY